MRLMTAVSVLVLSAGFAAGQPPQQAVRNGALDYWRAGAVAANAAKGAKETAISKLSWDLVGTNTDPAKMPPEFVAAQKEVSEDAVREFMRGAAAGSCDFQSHREDGWKMLMPELAIVRDLTRMVRVDARAKLMAGDAHGAAERVEAMYRAAGHVAHEDVMIASLVAIAISRSAGDEARVLAASGKLSGPDREKLLAAVGALRVEDGLRVLAAVKAEQAITTAGLRRDFSGPDGAARMVKELFADAQGDEKGVAEQVAKMTPAEFSDAVAKLDQLYEVVSKAWSAPDPKRALSPVELSLVKGDYGPLARLLAPSMGRALDARLRAEADLDSIVATLKQP